MSMCCPLIFLIGSTQSPNTVGVKKEHRALNRPLAGRMVVTNSLFFNQTANKTSWINPSLIVWVQGLCQNLLFCKIGWCHSKCWNWKVPKFESAFLWIYCTWNGSELENVRTGKCQNWKVSELESVRFRKCPYLKVSDMESVFESVRFGKCIWKCQIWKVYLKGSDLQSVIIWKCQNWKMSEFKSVGIGKCQIWTVSLFVRVKIGNVQNWGVSEWVSLKIFF